MAGIFADHRHVDTQPWRVPYLLHDCDCALVAYGSGVQGSCFARAHGLDAVDGRLAQILAGQTTVAVFLCADGLGRCRLGTSIVFEFANVRFRATKIFLEKTGRHIDTGIPENWTGVEEMSSK